ncbi:MAG: hypothetical protein CBB68_00690 [Rhodospirillaceae bacterium TMED8]|nr:hypothetical protein [Magnetovibrio sp.]OUT53204.1 MAG: hypothetical protein CBB68_00690 [Rhodospirillaceae bacterium TMED8]|tara:strand:+ start:1199 stop:1702 length:504 start_codon:yes stop_codon:yes gene_type:complete
MNYTLDEFATDCRMALQANHGPEGYEAVRQHVMRALTDELFVATYLGEDNTIQRQILYEDSELGFCICAHVYDEAKEGSPHDHGPTWAIYGQAIGETKMTDWEIVSPPEGDVPGKVRLVRSYTLIAGDAHVYKPGDIHAPLRDGPTRLIRIEGQNTDKVKRTLLEAV